VQVKLKSLENTCHTWALLRWWFTTKRRYIKCMHPLPLTHPQCATECSPFLKQILLQPWQNEVT